jgi:histidyl-tRNA synthetase
MSTLQRPRGTRDFTPLDMKNRRFIEKSLRNTAISFGYSEIGTPTFEHAELFIRKSGEEIVNQLYLFRDKGDRELVLRPELTAPVIRFYANDLYKQPKPFKVFYQGNCFRYERPQKGRFREFWQFGAELIGTDRPEGIAELVAFAHACLSNSELTNFEIRIGHIEILKNILNEWKIPEDTQAELMTLIDKGDLATLENILEKHEVVDTDVNMFSGLIQYKFSSSEMDEQFKIINNQFPIISHNLDRLKSVIGFLKFFNVNDLTIDFGIARGIDYYNGIVFEIDVAALGAEKQVCGGGEYSLDELFNLQDIACSGFAIGFDRLALAYEQEGLSTPGSDLDIYIIPILETAMDKVIEISSQLRAAGFSVEMDIKGRNMSKNLKFASSRKAKHTIFVGEDELKAGEALVRIMASGEQSNIKFENLVEHLKNTI